LLEPVTERSMKNRGKGPAQTPGELLSWFKGASSTSRQRKLWKKDPPEGANNKELRLCTPGATHGEHTMHVYTGVKQATKNGGPFQIPKISTKKKNVNEDRQTIWPNRQKFRHWDANFRAIFGERRQKEHTAGKKQINGGVTNEGGTKNAELSKGKKNTLVD